MEFLLGQIFPLSINLPTLLTVSRTEVRERVAMSRLCMEGLDYSAPDEPVRAAESTARRKAHIPGPTEFSINLKVCIDDVTATCP
jgi:DNA-binding FadR family transcriptional regulator